MTKLPEGRKPLPNEWFVDRAKKIQPDEDKKKDDEDDKCTQ